MCRWTRSARARRRSCSTSRASRRLSARTAWPASCASATRTPRDRRGLRGRGACQRLRPGPYRLVAAEVPQIVGAFVAVLALVGVRVGPAARPASRHPRRTSPGALSHLLPARGLARHAARRHQGRQKRTCTCGACRPAPAQAPRAPADSARGVRWPWMRAARCSSRASRRLT